MDRKRCRVVMPDHSGDSTVATFDPDVAETVKIADEALDKFMADCIARFGPGAKPLISGRMAGDSEYKLMQPGDTVAPFEHVILTRPLSGG